MRQVDKKRSRREKEEAEKEEEEKKRKSQHKNYAKLGLFCYAVRWLPQSTGYIFFAVLFSLNSRLFFSPTQLGGYCKYDINREKFFFFI